MQLLCAEKETKEKEEIMFLGQTTPVQDAAIMTLVNLAKLFTPGVKLTLVARHITDDTAFMIFSEDSLEKVIETIQQHIKKQRETLPVKAAPSNNNMGDV